MSESVQKSPPLDDIGMCRYCRRFDNHRHEFTNGGYAHGWYPFGDNCSMMNTTFIRDPYLPIGEEVWRDES